MPTPQSEQLAIGSRRSQQSAALGPEQDGPLDIHKLPAFRRRPRDTEFREEGTEGAGDEGPKSSIRGCESNPRPSVPGGSEELLEQAPGRCGQRGEQSRARTAQHLQGGRGR